MRRNKFKKIEKKQMKYKHSYLENNFTALLPGVLLGT